IPGALPPVIGWCAARGEVTGGGRAPFLILFVWEGPPLPAVARVYRDQKPPARPVMVPPVDRRGGPPARPLRGGGSHVVPVSLVPALLGSAGPVYCAGAVLLGLGFLACGLGFRRAKTLPQARRVLRASLLYLPGLLALLLLDGALPWLLDAR